MAPYPTRTYPPYELPPVLRVTTRRPGPPAQQANPNGREPGYGNTPGELFMKACVNAKRYSWRNALQPRAQPLAAPQHVERQRLEQRQAPAVRSRQAEHRTTIAVCIVVLLLIRFIELQPRHRRRRLQRLPARISQVIMARRELILKTTTLTATPRATVCE